MANNELTFDHLVDSILKVHKQLASQAGRAVNISLTLRNWMIGYYISEYELRGVERATYGERLLTDLSNELRKHRISNTGRRQLYNYLLFYRKYPQIVRTVPAQSSHLISSLNDITEKVRTASAQLIIPPEKLLNTLSYSHLEQLININEDTKRVFYEIECIRGNWSVRELKRQIASLYYERSGLLKNKEKLAELVRSGAESAEPELAVRDPYIFEFLGLKPQEVMGESDLEDQLLDKLQGFLLEMGVASVSRPGRNAS